ncbi:uncharacterized protein LOC126843580 [Adelges cooleyi]|uniref:uncharacterized protein LOC126843580 n=1 Tax=Adelges cooleyi TaxID=133065 RepID=UPI00217FC760|nr:uncharacterized protein LOC126843580 [Adelges cooleyi]
MGVSLKFGLVLSACVCLALADPIPAAHQQEDGCANKDSIACAQMQLFRTVRSFFDQDKVELLGGLSLVKSEKKGRSLTENSDDVNAIEGAKDANQRETALEDFTMHKVMRFFQERSLHWNLSPVVTEVTETARSVVDQIPPQIKTKISNFIEEGRGKKKKMMKHLLPLLIALKMKLVAFAGLAYIVIALIAKKALLASLISLLVSGFIGIKKLLSHHHPHHEVIESHHGHSSYGGSPAAYSGSSSGWDSYGSGGHDAHGSYSNNVAQTMAYGAQKPAAR